MIAIIKILADVLEADRDNNILFSDLQRLLDYLGFRRKVKGSHFIYWREGIDEIINIQPEAGKAKAYQVRQVRNISTVIAEWIETAELLNRKIPECSGGRVFA